tara:strand:+ start:13054 stop:14523 length:1470 start_codon:yes stop_codon:yes gene_type:complete
MTTPHFILIPHAGKKFAGDCRRNVLQKFSSKQIKNIIYITALHNSFFLKRINKDKNFIIKDQCKLFVKPINNFVKLNKVSSYIKEKLLEEHSYKWVKDELKFLKAKHTVITPGPKVNINDYSNFVELLKIKDLNNSSTLIIGTTDLIHYGPKFNLTNFKSPEQTEKLYQESKFIDAINQLNINRVNELYDKRPYLCCGINSIRILLRLVKSFDNTLKGQVYDYYDSVQSRFKDIRRYSNDFNFGKSRAIDYPRYFVSYVSIKFEKEKNKLTNIDKNLAQGCLRNIFIKSYNMRVPIKSYNMRVPIKVKYDDEKYYIPLWSNWYKIYNGIFVGISLDNNTKCSTGQFENDKNKKTSAENIYLSSKNCYNDSKERWKGKDIKKEDISKIKYKVELLDAKKDWKKVDLEILIKNEEDYWEKGYGFYLKITDKQTTYDATYLPNVWEEALPDEDIKGMLNQLALKATNRKFGLEDKYETEIYIYQSKKFNKKF